MQKARGKGGINFSGYFDIEKDQYFQSESLDIFCLRCEILTCRHCQLSSQHDGHDCLPSHEVSQEVKAAVAQSQGDIRLKRNLLDESRAMLGSKLAELNIKVRLPIYLESISVNNGSLFLRRSGR